MSELRLGENHDIPFVPAQESEDTESFAKPELAQPQELLITYDAVRNILDTRNRTMPRDRIAKLMTYAYEATGELPLYEPLPERVRTIDFPMEAWIKQWLNTEVIHNRGRQRVKIPRLNQIEALTKDAFDMRYLMEDSADFEERYEWMENAEHIRRMMPLHREPFIAATAVRVILVEAEEAEQR